MFAKPAPSESARLWEAHCQQFVLLGVPVAKSGFHPAYQLAWAWGYHVCCHGFSHSVSVVGCQRLQTRNLAVQVNLGPWDFIEQPHPKPSSPGRLSLDQTTTIVHGTHTGQDSLFREIPLCKWQIRSQGKLFFGKQFWKPKLPVRKCLLLHFVAPVACEAIRLRTKW